MKKITHKWPTFQEGRWRAKDAVNDFPCFRVEMPAPDNTFGIYHTAESGT